MTLARVLQGCALPRALINNLFTFVLGRPELPNAHQEIAHAEVVLLWIIDTLMRAGLFADAGQALFAASKLRAPVAAWLQADASAAYHVAIVDRQYLAMDGDAKMYDLRTSAPATPEAALESIVYNVAVLLQRRSAAYEDRGNETSACPPPADHS